jgi:putative ABC transport system permease protein
MKLLDSASLALNTLQHRQLRSWLAILGIIVGVAAIISLISISLGMSAQISSRMSTLGANVITISPGGQSAQRMALPGFGSPTGRPGGEGGPSGGPFGSSASSVITFREADELRSVAGVEVLDARVQGRGTVSYKDKNASLTVVGSEPQAFSDSVGVEVLYGRALGTNDQYSAVIGYSVANATFDDFDILNKQVKIDGVPFRVVGILASSGTSGFGSADSNIYVPQRTAKALFNQTEDVSSIVVVVSEGYDTEAVASSLTSSLLSLHRLSEGEADFTVQTAATMQEAVSSVTETLSIFLGGIASISLIVGGIGVANTMFMSVLEQTKYIGLLKSIGAKNRDVLRLFLLEAGIIGFIGGALGVLLSIGVSYLLTLMSIPSALSFELVGGGLMFSVVVGLASGLVPARNAAALEPIDALRYE